jgi:lipid-A-disaccharide synthase
MEPRIFLVAGEASSDLHAAALAAELKKVFPGMKLYGVGGKALQAEGMDIIVSSEVLNAVGISDWWGKAREMFVAYRKVKKAMIQNSPDCAVLLDLPDFNLLLARKLKKAGIPVVYYISPQVWAWSKSSISFLKSSDTTSSTSTDKTHSLEHKDTASFFCST